MGFRTFLIPRRDQRPNPRVLLRRGDADHHAVEPLRLQRLRRGVDARGPHHLQLVVPEERAPVPGDRGWVEASARRSLLFDPETTERM